MMFLIFLGLVILAVAFFHYTQGFFSATISAILCIFAAVLSISYHEVIVEKYLGGAMASSAHGAVVLVLFALIYLVCRLVFDKLIPGNVTLPSGADKAGAAVMGIVAGFFAAGLCAFAAQSMGFKPALMGYARLAYEEDRYATIPQEGGGRNVSLHMHDSINSTEPLHLAAEVDQKKLIVPADDILIDMIQSLSDGGALASRPLASIHPNWLNEMFGQRLGMQAAANRIAMNKPDGTQTDVIAIPGTEQYKDAGIYWLDKQLPQKVHEYETIARAQRDKLFPKANPKLDPSKIILIFRVYFGEKARDNKDNIIRLSMGAIRLVAQKKVTGTDGYQWTNYHPLGTIEEGVEFWFNRADDFLFIDDRTQDANVKDKGIDLVFQVEKDGFLKSSKVPDPTQTVIADGTFIEVKRMARVDLSGQPILPMAKLKPNKAVQVMRKTLVKKPPKVFNPAQPADTAETITQKLVGKWEAGTDDGGKLLMTVDQVRMEMVTLDPSGKEAVRTPGNWKIVASDSGFQLEHSGAAGTKVFNDKYGITFPSDNEVLLENGEKGFSKQFNRQGAAPQPSDNPPPTTPTPPTTPQPAPPTTPAPPPAAAKADTSLAVVELIENRKFYAPVRIADGSTGEVKVEGGSVTLEDGKIKAINLTPVTPEKLNAGTGEPLNQLVAETGSIMVQLECTPGTGNGWAWKDKVEQITVADKTGKKYRPVGVWALVNGGTEIVARYNADGTVSLADFTPAGPPTKIYFAYVIPEDQQVTKVDVGNAPLKAFDAPVP